MSQKDLFEFSTPRSAFTQTAAQTPPRHAMSFLEQTRLSIRLDHLLTVSIALMVSAALIYTSGIERGKSIHQLQSKPSGAVSAKVVEAQPANVLIEGPKSASSVLAPGTQGYVRMSEVSVSSTSSSETVIASSKSSEKPDGSYTIQLATYKAESIAQKRVEALSSQGLEGFLIPSGSYYQVCVNGFSKRIEASQTLTKLKSKGIAPRDAYVRNIPA